MASDSTYINVITKTKIYPKTSFEYRLSKRLDSDAIPERWVDCEDIIHVEEVSIVETQQTNLIEWYGQRKYDRYVYFPGKYVTRLRVKGKTNSIYKNCSISIQFYSGIQNHALPSNLESDFARSIINDEGVFDFTFEIGSNTILHELVIGQLFICDEYGIIVVE